MPVRLLFELLGIGLLYLLDEGQNRHWIHRSGKRPAEPHETRDLAVEQSRVGERHPFQESEELGRRYPTDLSKRILHFQWGIGKTQAVEQRLHRLSISDPTKDDGTLPLDLLLLVPQPRIEHLQGELSHERSLPRRVEGQLRIQRSAHQMPEALGGLPALHNSMPFA